MNIDLEWTTHLDNPLISPVWPEWLVGDPWVIPPEKAPDGKWHMFLNTILWVWHYTSSDGVAWRRRHRVCHGMRAFVFEENGEFFLFYERHLTLKRSDIMVRRSRDLFKWSMARKILSPATEWETEGPKTMACPCIVKHEGKYRLYYSTNEVFLKDLGFPEPKYIGLAESDRLLGPYEKRPEPVLGPRDGHPYRNLGAGAMKVYRDEEHVRWLAFNNGIYADEAGRSRSSIMILESADGIDWKEALPEPIISPEGDGWRKALVYQLCAVERPGGELWIYYNCRDGWRVGTERIGLEIGRPRV